MTVEQLTDQLIAAGLFPIRIEEFSIKGETDGLTFVGGLDEFVKAAKAMGANIVFIASNTLKEDDFWRDVDLSDDFEDDEVSADNEEMGKVYLPTILPELDKYVARIGEDGIFKVSVWTKSGPPLSLYLKEIWLMEFLELLEKAVEKVEAEQQSVLAEVERKHQKEAEEREKEEKKLLAKLKSLLDDSEFTRLQTLRAMQTYALDKFPELAGLNTELVKAEITTLSDLIKIRGLSRRK